MPQWICCQLLLSKSLRLRFLHAYSKIATLRLIFEGRHIQFAAGHEALLNISYVALAVPLVILGAWIA